MWLLYDLNKIVFKKFNKSINNNNFTRSELMSSVEIISLQSVTFLIPLNTKKVIESNQKKLIFTIFINFIIKKAKIYIY